LGNRLLSDARITDNTTARLRRLIPVLLPALLCACAASPEPKPEPRAKDPFDAVEWMKNKFGGDRPYIVLENKRYVSGPYGDRDDVMRVIEAVKNNSTPVHISNRAVNLPNKPANLSLAVYSYVTPPECGGRKFHVYEGDQLQILQYDYEDGLEPTIIRDYTVGPTQFVAAGLWGPYDHTESTAMEMCLLPGNSAKDGGGLMEGNYEIGWITNITDWKQAELGNEYASAVKIASRCLAGDTGGSAVHQFYVRPGDSLSEISLRVYGNKTGWKAIYDANRELIGPDPNNLPKGVILIIP
jgi:nucleoid-associated protein YgaU